MAGVRQVWCGEGELKLELSPLEVKQVKGNMSTVAVRGGWL